MRQLSRLTLLFCLWQLSLLQPTKAVRPDGFADSDSLADPFEYNERIDPGTFLAAEVLLDEEKVRDEWIADTPHQPTPALEAALSAAAFPTQRSRGLVILTSGSHFPFHHLLPRWLDSLSRTRDGDMTRHAVVQALGASSMALCEAANAHHRHQCVPHEHWPGPDRQYHFGDDWYVAVTLSKVELMTNVLDLDYALFWVDTDVVFFGNPLPHLEGMAVDMALGMERCDVVANFSRAFQGAFQHNTGTVHMKPTAAARRFLASWLGFQKQHLLEWGPADFNKSDGNQRRSDQITLNHFALPHHISEGHSSGGQGDLVIEGLSHDRFPNYCGGYCGCQGQDRRGATSFLRFENRQGHLMSGRVECPAYIVDRWFTFHMPCTWSTAEKAALLDCYQHLADRLYSRALAAEH